MIVEPKSEATNRDVLHIYIYIYIYILHIHEAGVAGVQICGCQLDRMYTLCKDNEATYSAKCPTGVCTKRY